MPAPTPTLRSRALRARQLRVEWQSYWLSNQMFGFRQDLALAALPAAFSFRELVEKRGKDQQRKFRRPGDPGCFISRLLEARMKIERFGFLEQLAEQLFLQPIKMGFQLLPFEPRRQFELVAFVEVEPG